MKLQIVAIIVGVVASFVTGCSSSQKSTEVTLKPKPQSSNPFERTVTVKVAGLSDGTSNQKTIFFPRIEDDIQSLKVAPLYHMISRALGEDGFIEVEKESQAFFVIEPVFAIEKPITGVPVLGNLTPYIHKVTIRAKHDKIVFWELTLTGGSEHEDPMLIMPVLLAAGLGFYGKATTSPIEVRIQNTSPEVKTIKGQ